MYEKRALAMDRTTFWIAPIPHVSMPFVYRLLDRVMSSSRSSEDPEVVRIERAFQPRTLLPC